MSLIANFRARAPSVRVLDDAMRSTMHRRMRHAEIGIIGFERTGKKTLAARFSAMNQGPFVQEIRSFYFSRAVIDLDNRETNGSGDVSLIIFLIPSPRDLPIPPIYFIEGFFNFSAMVLLCSVVSKPSLDAIVDVTSEFYEEGIPYFLIVGNKKDLNRVDYPDHFTFDYGSSIARNNFAVNYHECSAKENIDVDPILEEILRQIVFEQPE